MTAPRRMRDPDEQRGSTTADFDWKHRRGLAFAELLEHLPTDHLHTRTAATVVVTLDHTVLTAPSRPPGSTPASRLRRRSPTPRLQRRILPAVLGTRSVALDLGRETRLFSEAQRIAVGLTHNTCAADGCQRPFAWCELHHRQPWCQGGRTDLADAIPLCHWHHQRIHDPAYNHHRMPDGSIRFSRRT